MARVAVWRRRDPAGRQAGRSDLGREDAGRAGRARPADRPTAAVHRRPVRGRRLVGDEFLAGRAEPRHDEVVDVSLRLHQATADLPKPRFLDARTDVFAIADRCSWGEETGPLDTELGGRLFELLSESRKPITLTPQVVHGDLFGNVLFAGRRGARDHRLHRVLASARVGRRRGRRRRAGLGRRRRRHPAALGAPGRVAAGPAARAALPAGRARAAPAVDADSRSWGWSARLTRSPPYC